MSNTTESGDFIKLPELSKKLLQDFVDPPDHFRDIVAVARSLCIGLGDVEVSVKAKKLDDTQLASLEAIARSGHGVLDDLSRLLHEHGKMDLSRPTSINAIRTTATRQELAWSPEDVNNLHIRIVTVVLWLNTFQHSLEEKKAITTRANAADLLQQNEDQSLQVAFRLPSFVGRNKGPSEGDMLKILFDAYAQTMAMIRSQQPSLRDPAEKALTWIICSARPLQTHELQAALDLGVSYGDSKKKQTVQTEDAISTCAGLVAVDERSAVVRLVHSTAQEYFERTLGQWFTEPNLKIAKECVATLSSDQPSKLVHYASKFWSHHLRQEPKAQREEWVMDFLQLAPTTAALSSVDVLYTSNQATKLHIAAYFGLDAAVDALIQSSHDPNVREGRGRTPIFYAAKKGHCSTIKTLVEHGAKIDIKIDDFNHWAIEEAAHEGLYDVVELLLEIEAQHDPRIKSWEYADAKNVALGKAVIMGDAKMVTLLLDKGASTEYRDQLGNTALMGDALRSDENMDMIRLLIERGANVNCKDRSGQTVLMKYLANRRVNREKIELLLENGVDIEGCDNQGRTALAYVAEVGNGEMVRLLIEHGAEIEGHPSGPTPLYLAIHEGHAAVVNSLLRGGADPDKKTDWQQISSLELAERLGKLDLVTVLQDYSAKQPGWQDWIKSYF